MAEDTQARRYCLTINNPEQSDEEFIEYVGSLEHFKYCKFQREKGEKTGTEHFQVFITFTCAKRFSTIKKYFPTAHIEKARGSNAEARDYCCKEDTRVSGPYELGTFSEECSRTDISNFIELIQLGASDLELAKLYPRLYLQNINRVQKIRQDYLANEFRNKNRDIEVTYIYGPPRTGKTRYVYDKYGFGKFYHLSNYNNSAFDAYKSEDILVLDEFKSQFKLEFMNRLLDRYPFDLPARFENKVACFTKVYIISNYKIDDLYKDAQRENMVGFNAFKERIKTIIRIDKSGQFIERENFKDLYRTEFIYLTKEEEKHIQATISDMF